MFTLLASWVSGRAASIRKGDILVVDRSFGFSEVPSRILKVDPVTGQATTLAILGRWSDVALPNLRPGDVPTTDVYPSAMAVDPNARVVISLSIHFRDWDTEGQDRRISTARLMRLDPESGIITSPTQDGLRQPASDPIGGEPSPVDFDVDPDGRFVVAQRGELIRVDAGTGMQSSFSRFDRLNDPIALAVDPLNGDVFVQERSGNILRIDGDTRAHSGFFDVAAYFLPPPSGIVHFGMVSMRDLLVDGEGLISYGGGCIVRFPRDGSDPALVLADGALWDLAYLNAGSTMALNPEGDLIFAGMNIEPPNSIFRIPAVGGPPEVFALLRDYTIAALTVVGDFAPLTPKPPSLSARAIAGGIRLAWASADASILVKQSGDLKSWRPAVRSTVVQSASSEFIPGPRLPNGGSLYRLVRRTGATP